MFQGNVEEVRRHVLLWRIYFLYSFLDLYSRFMSILLMLDASCWINWIGRVQQNPFSCFWWAHKTVELTRDRKKIQSDWDWDPLTFRPKCGSCSENTKVLLLNTCNKDFFLKAPPSWENLVDSTKLLQNATQEIIETILAVWVELLMMGKLN